MGKIKKKTAMIFGVTGQDGSYLAELLLKKIILFMGLKDAHLVLIQKGWIIFLIVSISKIKIFIFTMAM
jgi:GDP-D-mannose dehydratase